MSNKTTSNSRAKKQRSAPATPPPAADSLDFTELAADNAPAAAAGSEAPSKTRARASAKRTAAGVQSRKIMQASHTEPRSSKTFVFISLLLAVAAIAVFVVQRSSETGVTPPPVAKVSPPAYQSPLPPTAPHVAQQSAQPHAAPRPAATPTSAPNREIPAEFLQEFQSYAARSGGKAIALALDSNGRWAYGAVSGLAGQAGADQEALSDCARYKAEARVQADCRLYALGDKVVW